MKYRMGMIVFFALFVGSINCRAAPVGEVVSVDFGGRITRWDIGADALLNSWDTIDPGGIGAVAKMQDGRLIAARTNYQGGQPGLYEIDPDTSSSVWLGPIQGQPNRLVALTSTPNNKLLGYNNNLLDAAFYLVDPDTREHERVDFAFSNQARSFSSGSLATAPDGRMYGWVGGSITGVGIYNGLFEFDLASRKATQIGPGFLGYQSTDSMHIAFDATGQLFGYTDINGGSNGGPLQPNAIYQFDLDTGMPAFVRTGEPSRLNGSRGFEFVTQVPEPAIFSVAMLAAACWARRRRSRL